MGLVRKLLISLMLLAMLDIAKQQQQSYTVVYVSELMRHGARTPNSNILKMQEKTSDGQLTANGQRMAYLLGSQIRSSYSALFSDIKYNEFEVYSSTKQRCIQSAYSHLAGVFPLGSGSKITPEGQPATPFTQPPIEGLQVNFKSEFAIDKGYRVVPIRVSQYDMDFLFMPYFAQVCPSIGAWVEKQHSASVKKYQPLVNRLSEDLKLAGIDSKKLVNKDTFDLGDIAHVYDELVSFQNSNGKLDSRFSLDLFKKVKDYAALEYNLWFEDKKWTQIFLDSMSRQLVTIIEEYQNGGGSLKYSLFSGHDINILGFDRIFNLTSVQCHLEVIEKGSTALPCLPFPEFSTSYIFELSTKSSKTDLYVRVLRNGKPINVCKNEDPTFYCPSKTFISLVEANILYAPAEKSSECGSLYYTNPAPLRQETLSPYSRLPILTVSLMAITLVVVNLLLLFKPSSSQQATN